MLKPRKKVSDLIVDINFRRVGGKVLVTNESGRHVWLSEERFQKMLDGDFRGDKVLYDALDKNLFLKNKGYIDRAVSVAGSRKAFLGSGPNLHIMILTLRCNYTCVYCHASRKPMSAASYDMPIEIVEKTVDTIFQSPSQYINIEFQGGEPLVNWDALKHTIEYAKEKNKEAGKNLAFTVVSNLSRMDEEKLEFLIKHNGYLCTSVDGPKELHERNRPCSGASSYDMTVKWIKRFHEEYQKLGYDLDLFHVDALMTTTRASLSLYKEIIDEYVKLGLKSIHLRPLNPFGFVEKTWNKIGYTAEEFGEFYDKSLDYILELNLGGVELIERMASIYLTKILTDNDPGYMELRSPCGAGIGQIAYDYNGKVFTCDEGRMMDQMGDNIFQMGDLNKNSYADMIESATVKTLTVASLLDGSPYCASCAYKPFCGICPIYNYATQGDIVGCMPTNDRCKQIMSNFDKLFTLLMKEDEKINQIFNRWITTKARQIDACGTMKEK